MARRNFKIRKDIMVKFWEAAPNDDDVLPVILNWKKVGESIYEWGDWRIEKLEDMYWQVYIEGEPFAGYTKLKGAKEDTSRQLDVQEYVKKWIVGKMLEREGVTI